MSGATNGAEQEAPAKVQKSVQLSELESLAVAQGQKEHNRLVAEVKALIDRANAVNAEAQSALRRAVETVFRNQEHAIPTAEVKIVNNEQGAPAALVWEEAAAPEPTETAAEDQPAEETSAAPAKPAVNGKAAPEAARKRLPLNK